MSDSTNAATLARLLKVIADESRLRILGALAETALTGKELAERLSLTPATVSHHMRKLVDAGIVDAEPDAQRVVYRLNSDALTRARKTPLDHDGRNGGTAAQSLEERTLRHFFDGDRLKSIPAERKQRVVVLKKLMERFDPDREYPEREVNGILGAAHEDFATLRRELVDYGYLTRERGTYRVARSLPRRSVQVRQETGDEATWLASLLEGALNRAER